MGFVRRRPENDEAAQSREQIEDGGLPVAARRRLESLKVDGGLFTSGLSVSEFSLLDQDGHRPLAQVMGASVVRPGLQLLPALVPGVTNPSMGLSNAMASAQIPMTSSRNLITDASPSQVRNYKWRTEVVCELDMLTSAWNTARRRALDRLAEETLVVGGDAVVGVHLHRGDQDLGARTINYLVRGTAIRAMNSSGDAWPTLTNLSGQDLWRLERAGYAATGLLAASIAVFAAPPLGTRLRRMRTTRRNQELTELSQGFHLARDTLRARLQGQVADAHGDGAVGVRFSHTVHREKISLASSLYSVDRRGWQRGRLGVPYYVSGRGEAERRGWVITMHVAGTAVRRRQGAAPEDVKTAIRMGA